jgi:diguanylate cyclase (GGDEF)-like protein
MNKRFLKADGSIIWANVTVVPFVSQGSLEPMHLVMMEDITRRKLAEEEILYLSYHNQLTGIYNRRYYELALCEMDRPENLPLTLVLADVNGLKLINDAFGHLAGDQLLKTVARILQNQCRKNDVAAKIGGDEFVLLLPNTGYEEAQLIIDKIRANISNEKINNIYCSVSFGLATKKSPLEEIVNIYMQAEDKMYRNKFFESASMRSETIKIITKTLYEKNKQEQLHCERVSRLCEATGKALGWNSSDVGELRMAGLMHDIGKIGIDQRLLTKNGQLTNEEWSDIKRHPEIGYQILKSIGELSPIAEHVLYHHERVDGAGYPRGIKEGEIPIQSKIISIADAYDRMTQYCCRKAQLSRDDAIREILSNSGSQFDKGVAQIFINKVLDS